MAIGEELSSKWTLPVLRKKTFWNSKTRPKQINVFKFVFFAELPRFYLLPKGNPGCPSNERVKSITDCRAAIIKLGLKPGDEWTGSTTGIPSGCSFRVTSFTTDNGLHWNTQTSGANGRNDMQPVCDRGLFYTNYMSIMM